MIGRLAERVLFRLAVRTLAPDPYGRAILDDLVEARDEMARSRGDDAANWWFRRELLRSWLAFFPSLGFDPRHAVAGASVGLVVYAVAVNVAAPLAFRLAEALHGGPGLQFDATYLTTVASIGAAAGFVLTFPRRMALPRLTTFVALAAAFGARHIITSAQSELAFRSGKVAVFIACALIAGFVGLTAGGAGRSERTDPSLSLREG